VTQALDSEEIINFPTAEAAEFARRNSPVRRPGGFARVPCAPSDLKRFQIEAFLIFTRHSCPVGVALLTENP
jgi:hypothetical protein